MGRMVPNFFDPFSDEFRAYFRRHVLNAIRFVIKADFESVRDYMKTVIKFGPHGINSIPSQPFGPINILQQEQQFDRCVQSFLNILLQKGEIRATVDSGVFYYYIPAVRKAYRKQAAISKVLFIKIVKRMKASLERAELNRPYGATFDELFTIVQRYLRSQPIPISETLHQINGRIEAFLQRNRDCIVESSEQIVDYLQEDIEEDDGGCITRYYRIDVD